MSPALPYRWHNTPNVHFLSLKDFEEFCREKGLKVLSRQGLTSNGQARFWPNLFGESAVFKIAPGDSFSL